MAGFLLFGEEIKWAAITVVIALSALVVMIAISSFLERDVNSENIDFMLEKEYFKRDLVSNGVLEPSKLEDVQELKNTGVLFDIGESKYYSNKARYDEYVFCGQFKRNKCHNYQEVYLVDGELKIVNIKMVMKVE